MLATPTAFPDVVLLAPTVHADDRGYFFEAYNRRAFAEAVGIDPVFVQENQSRSVAGVIRGIHYQIAPHEQGKLVRVLSGAIYDVVVDLRRSSPTFLRWVGVGLDADSRQSLWIPAGFGHGFAALTDAEILYLTTALHSAECERSVRWNDPAIGVVWPLAGDPTLSDRDARAPFTADADLFD